MPDGVSAASVAEFLFLIGSCDSLKYGREDLPRATSFSAVVDDTIKLSRGPAFSKLRGMAAILNKLLIFSAT